MSSHLYFRVAYISHLTGWDFPRQVGKPGLSRTSSGTVPGFSAGHLHNTRCSCPQLGAQRPPRGPLSCPPHDQALTGIPLVLHSTGENRLGADGEKRLRCRCQRCPTTLNSGPSEGPILLNLPCLQTGPLTKSHLFLHTHTICITCEHSSVTIDTCTCV